jgi:hypothetical protein
MSSMIEVTSLADSLRTFSKDQGMKILTKFSTMNASQSMIKIESRRVCVCVCVCVCVRGGGTIAWKARYQGGYRTSRCCNCKSTSHAQSPDDNGRSRTRDESIHSKRRYQTHSALWPHFQNFKLTQCDTRRSRQHSLESSLAVQ